MAGFAVPDGWTAQAYRFALDATPAQERAFWSHAGGARKAHNTMLALVKAIMDQRAAERTYGIAEACLTPPLNWSLVEADCYYPSSKTCSACGGRKPNLTLADRTYACQHCGLMIDRDQNAAINLARLGETHRMNELVSEQSPTDSGSVAGRGAKQETEPARAGDAAGYETSTPRQRPLDQTGTASPKDEAAQR